MSRQISGKHDRKARAKLNKRIDAYQATISRVRNPRAFTKPGSMRKDKQ